MLEVRRGESPSATQVDVDAVADGVTERTFDLFALPIPNLVVLRVRGERKGESVEDHLGKVVVAGTAGRTSNGAGQGRSKQAELGEVVEVARLQRSVLSIVRERQKLPGARVDRLVFAKALDHGKREDCCSCASAFRIPGSLACRSRAIDVRRRSHRTSDRRRTEPDEMAAMAFAHRRSVGGVTAYVHLEG